MRMSAMTAGFTPSAGASLSGASVALAYADAEIAAVLDDALAASAPAAAAVPQAAAASVLSVPAPGARI